MKYLLALLLFSGYTLPRQDAKLQVHTLPSGAKCVVTFEQAPFAKIGIQLALHGPQSDLDTAFAKALSSAGHPAQFQRTESTSLFQFYIPKPRVGSAEEKLRALTPIVNAFAKAHPDYFTGEVYLYVMGGFKRHDIPAALHNFLKN